MRYCNSPADASRPAAIIGRLIGSRTCRVDCLTVNADQPIFEMCRLLVQHGYEPAARLMLYRNEDLALTVQNIGIGASLTVNGKGTDFRCLKSVGIASPVRKSTTIRRSPTPANFRGVAP